MYSQTILQEVQIQENQEIQHQKIQHQEILAGEVHIARMAELLRSSSHPWRGKYVDQIIRQVKELLSAGQDETASLLLERLEKRLDKWKPEETAEKNTEKNTEQALLSGPTTQAKRGSEENIKGYLIQERHTNCSMITNRNNGFSLIARQIASWNSQEPVDSKILWQVYQQWNTCEAQVRDSLCLVLLGRLKFLQHLDFDEGIDGRECGPYNQRYNIIRSLKHLVHFNPEWLERYLLLYDSLQKFEETMSHLSELPSVRVDI